MQFSYVNCQTSDQNTHFHCACTCHGRWRKSELQKFWNRLQNRMINFWGSSKAGNADGGCKEYTKNYCNLKYENDERNRKDILWISLAVLYITIARSLPIPNRVVFDAQYHFRGRVSVQLSRYECRISRQELFMMWCVVYRQQVDFGGCCMDRATPRSTYIY